MYFDKPDGRWKYIQCYRTNPARTGDDRHGGLSGLLDFRPGAINHEGARHLARVVTSPHTGQVELCI